MIPSEERWPRPFFLSILPRLSAEDILARDGTIYLPFSAYVFKCVTTYREKLLKEYIISFVLEDEFKQLLLVKSTQTLSTAELAGKGAAKSEKLYCTTTVNLIEEQADAHITKENLVKHLNEIRNKKEIEDVRLIKLTRR
jgi:hypothetical protein